MGHTPAQRESHPLCGARKKNGSICRAFAGQGTEHFGIGKCRFHGGNTPNHKKHAVAVEAARAMIRFGAPIAGIQPHQALLSLLRATAGHVAWLHEQLANVEDVTAHDAQVLVRMYNDERDRLTRIGEACLRAGISAEEIRLRQQEMLALGTALSNAARTAGLDAGQQRALGRALREELQTYDTDDPAAAENAFVGAA
jgi:hypothetical protein